MSEIIHHTICQHINIRQLGLQSYTDVWHQMQNFTNQRDANTVDELWLVQHYPVFTQGQAGKAEHLLYCSDIPVVQSDRGGQITYHAPGQQIMYVLIDIKRRKEFFYRSFNVRELVSALENCVINTLADYGFNANAKSDAPGVYIEEQKICSLGLRIRKGCSFHGLALNINMDLRPFQYINPCGYAGLKMCQLSDLLGDRTLQCESVAPKLIQHFCNIMNYTKIMKQ